MNRHHPIRRTSRQRTSRQRARRLENIKAAGLVVLVCLGMAMVGALLVISMQAHGDRIAAAHAFDLVATVDGDAYVIDHDLTADDCAASAFRMVANSVTCEIR